jgi:putative hydrolase of the HAD superfamily
MPWGMAIKGIRGITFDAGGTLITANPGVGAVYSEIAAAHGIKVDAPTLDIRFRDAFRRMRSVEGGRASEETERRFWMALAGEVFAGFAEGVRFDRLFTDLWSAFAEPRRWRLLPDARETMSVLSRRGYTIAILSNFDRRLHPILEGLGFNGLAERVFISAEVGFAKPSREIFDHAAETLGLEPAELLHVGDSTSADADGALDAGWSTALLGGGHPGAHTIANLGELPALLDGTA